MKFPLSWLRERLGTDADLETIVRTMVEIGLEVEDVTNPADALARVSVGRIARTEPHPDADRLQVCTVETAEGEQQIVCGAPNARAGLFVAFAPVGTYVPGLDTTLTKAKIRGVESSGMLCSAKELEIGEGDHGIMELSEGAVGTPLAQHLGIDDPVIDFEVTPNRPDTNGVEGVARDLAAAGLGQFRPADVPKIEGEEGKAPAIAIDAADACPVFAGRIVRGVTNGASPDWLQERLRAVGLRPVNTLADITNYLSYDAARPLHVYDADKVTGTIRARMGVQGESFLGLDGKEHPVDGTMLVIADDTRVLGLGGIMGGEDSGATEGTVNVLIESALFDPNLIARTGRKTGIVSDARYRFERGVDPKSTMSGLDRATALIVELCGGTPSPVAIAGEIPDPRQRIDFPPAETKRLTGLDVPGQEAKRILNDLGFVVSGGSPWQVTVPSHRPDIEGSADLVEEIARIYGLDKLPTETLPPLEGQTGARISLPAARAAASRRCLTAAGYHEAVTWAFCDSAAAGLFASGTPALANPISSDLGQMRPSALPNLVLAVRRNAARGARTVRLFEVGGAYAGEDPADQTTVLSAVAWGPVPGSWDRAEDAPNVFTAKAAAIAVLADLGVDTANLMTMTDAPDHYHPGRKGRLSLGPKKTLATFGEIHPRVAAALDLPERIVACEVFLDAVPIPKAKAAPGKAALDLSALMPVRRDFAFVVPEDIAAEALLRAVRGADKSSIVDVRLFDVYRGKGVEEGAKSLALEVTFQPQERSFTDQEIDALAARIVAQAEKATGATLRA